jgi:hypothetical protein
MQMHFEGNGLICLTTLSSGAIIKSLLTFGLASLLAAGEIGPHALSWKNKHLDLQYLSLFQFLN